MYPTLYSAAMAKAFLEVTDGKSVGRRIPLDDELVLGRDGSGSESLGADDRLSRRHARFRRLDNGDYLLEDLGSSNGTSVNGQTVRGAHVLRPGDRVAVGNTVLRFASEDDGPPSASRTVVMSQMHRDGTPHAGTATATATPPPSGAGAPLPPSSFPPAGGGYGFPSDSGRPRRGRTLPLLLAGVVLLGAGVGIGYVIHSGKSSSTSTAQEIGVLDASGRPDPSKFQCAAANNGSPGSGHFRFITSSCEDSKNLIAQFPLMRGTSHGQTVYYVITDDSNAADAARRGVNNVPKLTNGVGTPAVMPVTVNNGVIDFPATVSFGKTRVLQPGPTGFPPAKAEPSAVGDPSYTPLIRMPDGTVLNAPQVANSTGQADKVLKLDTKNNVVLYQETEGRYEDKHVHYASFESGDPTAATIEDVTFAPALNTLPAPGKVGLQDGARQELVAFVNGPTGLRNPGRQGENSTVLDNADPHNILKEVPVLPGHDTVGDITYSPGWDVHFAQWSAADVAGGTRVELQSTDEVDQRVMMNMVTGPGGKPFGPSGFVVNCPLISIDIP